MISTKDRAEVLSLYHEYITYGAFPELVDIRNKRSFLNSIYQTVYLGDIITRNKIVNDYRNSSNWEYVEDTGKMCIWYTSTNAFPINNDTAFVVVIDYHYNIVKSLMGHMIIYTWLGEQYVLSQ